MMRSLFLFSVLVFVIHHGQSQEYVRKVITLGPHENSTDPNLDRGHRDLQFLLRDVPGFRDILGFNFTGEEIFCNCSSSFCGTKDIVDILTRRNMANVCIGRMCFHQKRFAIVHGKERHDEHWGCYGGNKEEADHFESNKHIFCADATHNTNDMTHTRCCSKSYCHVDIEDFPYPAQPKEEEEPLSTTFYVLSTLIILICLAVCGGIGYILYKKLRRKGASPLRLDDGAPLVEVNFFGTPIYPNNRYEPFIPDATNSTFVTYTSGNGNNLENLLRDLDGSVSAGMSSCDMGSLLQKNTFSSKLVRLEAIGQGRFGMVYKCLWKEQIVATKIIESRNEQSYYREVAMYKNGVLRHTNILQFLGDDMIDSGAGVERCLVFEYHQNGSLDKYLSSQSISVDIAVRMVFSMASGLSFLHNAMETTNQVKPPMAHRDLKSGNVLVKNNLMVCISDLGLAVCLVDGRIGVPNNNAQSDHFEIEHKERSELVEKCGTMRYLPPELLNDTMDLDIFEAFKSADIYSMGLVMYEICRRTHTEGEPTTPYEEALPYFRQIREAGGKVGDVDHEIMKKIVVDDQERPDMSPWWQGNAPMRELVRLMSECWTDDPQSRLTASNVIHSVQRLADQEGVDVTQT